MKKFKIKRDDVVIVMAGKHKGKTGKVLQVVRDRDRVIVEKVNLVQRHIKPRQGQAGGTIEKEASIHISNVALYNAEEGRPVKIGWRILEDGRKVRFDKKTGAVID
ncbi:MAG: 50S ribosomal protein L24 [Myxococcota bacterium]